MLGPGCLCYAAVVSLVRRPSLADVEQSYAEILDGMLQSLAWPGAKVIGSDLVLGDRKFAGHAQRRGRHALLHHGAILYDFNLDLMAVLREPRRRPHYRGTRRHGEFVCNAPIERGRLLESLSALARKA